MNLLREIQMWIIMHPHRTKICIGISIISAIIAFICYIAVDAGNPFGWIGVLAGGFTMGWMFAILRIYG